MDLCHTSRKPHHTLGTLAVEQLQATPPPWVHVQYYNIALYGTLHFAAHFGFRGPQLGRHHLRITSGVLPEASPNHKHGHKGKHVHLNSRFRSKVGEWAHAAAMAQLCRLYRIPRLSI